MASHIRLAVPLTSTLIVLTLFKCTSTAIKAPIATLDPAVGSVPPILLVFETIRNKYDARPQFDHNGVSIVLLDYLIVTALLLVTELDEWEAFGMPASSSDRSTTTDSSLYPLFPPQTTTPSGNSSREATFSTSTSVSSKHGVNGDLLLAAPSLTKTSSGRDHHPPSPSAESILFPPTASSAPSHGYLDPSFYGGDIPSVPQIPPQYQPASSDHKSSVVGSGHLRELPTPRPRQDGVRAKSSEPWPNSSPTLPRHVDSPSPVSSPPLRPLRQPYCPNDSHSNSLMLNSGTYRPLPQPPSKPSGTPSVSCPVEKRLLSLSVRSLPPTPATPPSVSQDLLHKPIAKEGKELADWMQLGMSTHRVSDLQGTALDPPPPAYDSVSFSTVEGHAPQHRVVS
jgi:hypothetical protein